MRTFVQNDADRKIDKNRWIRSRQIERWLLRLLIIVGFGTFIYYLSWWFSDGRLMSSWWVLLFCGAALYGTMQIVGNWLLYFFARFPQTMSSLPDELDVDVFVTAHQEPYDLIERTLEAACAMRGKQRTWLLDDGSDPGLAEMAKRLGAGYLTRQGHLNAKAGNINAALNKTNGHIVVIFDVDHVPRPDFLERSLGYFADPKVGFVQVMLTFGNGQVSWVANAAIETSLEFYNPTSLGADSLGGTTLMGSNSLIRRRALESIGGYQPGLAEDLATSLTLHAAGWKSAYVAEPLAPGLAPPSFFAWFIQQLKWARGVFELLLTTYPRLFKPLKWGQRLSYSVRMTKYWIGPAIGFHIFATIGILIFGNSWLRQAFHNYLIHIAPLALADVIVRHVAFRFYRHHSAPKTSFLRAVILVYATWPIYLLAWTMALLRWPLEFRSTPKRPTDRLSLFWLLPQVLTVLLIAVGTNYTITAKGHPISLLLTFAAAQGVIQLIFLTQWFISTELYPSKKRLDRHFVPTAVLDLDFHRLPDRIDNLEGYHQALILFRLSGQPVGQILLEVKDGWISGAKLRHEILEAAEWPFWQRLVHDHLRWELPQDGSLSTQRATVVVCTRDRPEDLHRCLEAISRLPDDGQEVIVIDSCSSTDETRQVVQSFPCIRYIREEFPGLNRARNRALREASCEIVAFVDDDAVPDPGWLRALVRNFKEPGVLCVTGLTMPSELESKAQYWFEHYSPFGRGFSRKAFNKHVIHPLAPSKVGAGANMAIRRSAIELLGPFDEVLDVGTPTHSGGDTEYFSRILSSGYQIIYDPAGLCWHRHRRTWDQLRRTLYGYGVGTYAFWTGKLILDGEWSVLGLALEWALLTQLPALFRSLLRFPNSIPVDLILAEILGCMVGPKAYLCSRNQIYAYRSSKCEPSQEFEDGEYHYSHL